MERDFEKSLCLGTGIPYMFLLLLISLPNGLILIVLYRNPLRCLRKTFYVFLAFIAAVNLLNGIVVCSGEVMLRFLCAFGKGNISQEGDVVVMLGYIGINISILLVTAMTVDRFVSVVYPHFYLREVKPRKVNMANFVICVFGSIFAALQLVPGLSLTVYRSIDVHMHSTFPLIINTLAYMGMFFFLRKRAQEDFKRQALMARNAQLHDKQRLRKAQMERKFATTSFFILLFLMLSMIPYFIVSALEAECYGCQDRKWFLVFKESCFLSLFLNSVLYPFLTAFRINNLNRSVKIVLCLRQHKDPTDFPLRSCERRYTPAIVITDLKIK
ncbi:uncharacterized protein LOC144665111 [Oculina patagonica]